LAVKKSVEEKETILKGTQPVDETLEPVVEDFIFQNQYKATILLSLGLKRSDASVSKIHLYCYFV
jgi:hypothetical protein